MSRSKAVVDDQRLAFTESARVAQGACLDEFEKDLVAHAILTAEREGDDCVSAKHVKHAACFLRTARRDGRAPAIFTLGSLLFGTGLSTAITLLIEAKAHTSVVCLGMLFAVAGITMMLMFRPGSR